MTGLPDDPALPNDAASPEERRERMRHLLSKELAQVDSPGTAEAVAQRLEELAAGKTQYEEEERAAQAPDNTPPPPVKGDGRPVDEAAAVLLQAAGAAVAPVPEPPPAVDAAKEVLAAPAQTRPPEVERGRSLLKDAVLRRMGPLQALDARLYLAVNTFPHAPWSDLVAQQITFWATGGWIWAGGLVLARLLGVRRTRGALSALLPSMMGATWIVEHPIKAYFRRRRPFIDIVRAMVVGKKPGSWSFPSGHTASSFACAWILSKRWPRQAGAFFALAGAVGFSRVYVGAHYPGDVLIGAITGTALSELIHRFNALLRRWDA